MTAMTYQMEVIYWIVAAWTLIVALLTVCYAGSRFWDYLNNRHRRRVHRIHRMAG